MSVPVTSSCTHRGHLLRPGRAQGGEAWNKNGQKQNPRALAIFSGLTNASFTHDSCSPGCCQCLSWPVIYLSLPRPGHCPQVTALQMLVRGKLFVHHVRAVLRTWPPSGCSWTGLRSTWRPQPCSAARVEKNVRACLHASGGNDAEPARC